MWKSAIFLQEAMSKPINFSNGIVPRIMPHIEYTIKTYGNVVTTTVHEHFLCDKQHFKQLLTTTIQ